MTEASLRAHATLPRDVPMWRATVMWNGHREALFSCSCG